MPPKNGTPANAEYTDLISLVIKQPKQGGFDYNDIENRIAISKAIATAKEKTGEADRLIELEDAHFKYLTDLVKTAKWTFWHADLLTFKEDVLAVK